MEIQSCKIERDDDVEIDGGSVDFPEKCPKCSGGVFGVFASAHLNVSTGELSELMVDPVTMLWCVACGMDVSVRRCVA